MVVDINEVFDSVPLKYSLVFNNTMCVCPSSCRLETISAGIKTLFIVRLTDSLEEMILLCL